MLQFHEIALLRFPAAAAAFFAAFATAATAAAIPRFSEEIALPSAGIAFHGMSGAVQKPVKPPQVRRWRWTRGEEEWFDERSDATELWRSAQTIGTWEDRKGNELLVARASALLPAALSEKGDVTQEEFAAAFSSGDNEILPTASSETLSAWIEQWTGYAPEEKPQLLPIHPSRLAKVWEFRFSDPSLKAWIVRLNTAQAGSRKTPRNWFAFVLKLAIAPRPGDIRQIDRTLRSDLLGSISATGLAAAAAAAEQDAKMRVRTPMRGEGEPIMDDRRAQAHASIEALDEWWHMDSEHYVVLSDAPGGVRAADSLLSMLETLRKHYTAAVPPFRRTIESTSVIRIFRRDEDYLAYLADSNLEMNPADTSGLFSGSRRELVIRPTVRGSTQDLGSVVRHEGFHQYIFSAWAGIRPSTWFNEGYAEFFASWKPKTDGKFEWTETGWEINTLERMAADEKLDWTQMLRFILLADQASFYNPPVFRSSSNSYALAYGIVYFLVRGAPFVRNKPYADILPTYIATMEETGDATQATLNAFRLGNQGSDTDFLERFAKDMRTFYKSESARRNARRAPL